MAFLEVACRGLFHCRIMIRVVAGRKRERASGERGRGQRRISRTNLRGISEIRVTRTKVCAEQADILAMNDEQSIPFGPGHPQYLEARALALSIAAIRKAQGKRNPVDFVVGSPDWERAGEDFARDVLRVLSRE
jgi:hypothetical protein